MAEGKHAKILTKQMQNSVLEKIQKTREPIRNAVIFYLSAKAGLRASEISNLKWTMITDPEGNIADAIHLPDKATKGKYGGRIIPMNVDLKNALINLKEHSEFENLDDYVVKSERGRGQGNQMPAHSIVNFFKLLYKSIGFDGCSSHSGRRTFITNVARKIGQFGGSIRDVRDLAGHSSIAMTQRYIDGSEEAKQKVIDSI